MLFLGGWPLNHLPPNPNHVSTRKGLRTPLKLPKSNSKTAKPVDVIHTVSQISMDIYIYIYMIFYTFYTILQYQLSLLFWHPAPAGHEHWVWRDRTEAVAGSCRISSCHHRWAEHRRQHGTEGRTSEWVVEGFWIWPSGYLTNSSPWYRWPIEIDDFGWFGMILDEFWMILDDFWWGLDDFWWVLDDFWWVLDDFGWFWMIFGRSSGSNRWR